MEQAKATAQRSEGAFTWLLVAAFVLFAGLTVSRHEMWRDEVQAWLIARDSPNLGALLYNTRFEVHPALWYLMLYPLTRLTNNMAAMQWLHLGIAAAAIFVWVRWAPFSRLQRALSVFGYYLVFEYAVVARNYALGVLFLFTLCALWPLRKRTCLPHAAVMFLLLQTSVYGVLMAFAYGLALTAEWIFDPEVRASLAKRKAQVIACALIVAAGVGWSAIQLRPPAERSSFTRSINRAEPDEKAQTLGAVWKAYAPLLPYTFRFWNKNLVESEAAKSAAGALLLAVSLLIFSRAPAATALFIGGAATMLALMAVKHGVSRHHGHLFLTFLAANWLLASTPPPAAQPGWRAQVERLRPAFLTAVLVLQALPGLRASMTDWTHPFSMAKETAAYLRQEAGPDPLVVASTYPSMPALAGYMGTPLYYPSIGEFGTWARWTKTRRTGIPSADVFRDAERLARERRKHAYVVLSGARRSDGTNGPEEIAHFRGSVVVAEEFRIYRVPYRPEIVEKGHADVRESNP